MVSSIKKNLKIFSLQQAPPNLVELKEIQNSLLLVGKLMEVAR